MSLISFDALPDSARLWSFHAERPLSDEETAALHTQLERFVSDWAAHRRDLTAGYTILYNQFVLLGVDESRLPASGCSIDSMVHALGTIGTGLGVEIIDAPEIAFRDGDTVRCVTRDAFDKLAAAGGVNAGTIVFNRMAARVGDLREGRWELPARDSWHARAFTLEEMRDER